jgi:nucleoside-diphosphate kinase
LRKLLVLALVRDELINSIKSLTPSPALAKEHYSDLSARPFYGGLVKYITSGTPVVAMYVPLSRYRVIEVELIYRVWEGKDIIKQGVRFLH